jgi:hypothetical protein
MDDLASAGCWDGGWDMPSEQVEGERRRSERGGVKAELKRGLWA